MIYQFKSGSHLSGNAQAVGERLEAIRAKRSLTPEAVVEDARPDDSPLHGYFEWDDKAAANAYRIGQAGHLIRCVTIVVEPESEPILPGVVEVHQATTVRAFLPVERQGDRIYEATAVALSDSEYRRQILQRAHGELAAVTQKYKELKELAEVTKAIDRVGEILSNERLIEG